MGRARVVDGCDRARDFVDQLLRIEWLACGESRASLLAPPALDTGIEPEKVIPSKVADAISPELLSLDWPRGERGRGRPGEPTRARVKREVQSSSQGMPQRAPPGLAREGAQ